MKRRWFIVGILVVIVVAVALVLRIVDSEADNNKCAEEQKVAEYNGIVAEYNGIVAEYKGCEVCEVLVDMGRVSRSTTVSQTIRVINRSTTPLVLVDYSTQCRCMWLQYSREPIAEGEYRDIELVFDSRGEWGSVGNYMEVTTSAENYPIVLWIGAEVE